MQRTIIPALGILTLVIAVGSARSDAKEDARKALIGKWKSKEVQGADKIRIRDITLADDGKASMFADVGDEGFARTGTFKLLDDDVLELRLRNHTVKMKFKVDKDTLEVSGPIPGYQGKTVKNYKLTRAK